MRLKARQLAVFCLMPLAIGCLSPALANDSMAVLGAGGIELATTQSIIMESEDLYISPSKVTVDYVFTNESDRDIETLVAFPMPDLGNVTVEMRNVPNEDSDNFMDFEVTQDGEPIEVELQQRAVVHNMDVTDLLTEKGVALMPVGEAARRELAEKLDAEEEKDWVARGLIEASMWTEGEDNTELVPAWTLKSTYWWRTVFPAGQSVAVHHSYRPSVGGTVDTAFLDTDGKPSEQMPYYRERYCVNDGFVKAVLAAKKNSSKNTLWLEKWLSYILVTGNNWSGPIGSFHLTVDKENPKNLVSFCGEGVRKTGPTTFEMTAEDFFPQRNLDVLIVYPEVVE
jgi:hypothetical protein